MRKISNENHIAAIVRKIYTDAQELDWEHLTHGQHTEQYARWLADDAIGGVLTKWMNPEEARVWLKDGPMKEYARAFAGEGSFAKYLDEYPRAPATIVRKALPDWTVVAGTVRVKPLQCRATKGSVSLKVFWGPPRDFKHLLWAALEAGHQPTKVIVFDTVANPLPDGERTRLLCIGKRCSVETIFIRL